MSPIPDDDLTRRVIDCATEVHRKTGPGLADTVYETCLAMELTKAGLPFERHQLLRPMYKGHLLDLEYHIDFVVAGALVVEVEADDEIEAVHEARLRTYVHFGAFPMGLLLNFNTVELEDGILRIAGNSDETWNSPPDGVDVFDDPDVWLEHGPANSSPS